MLAPLIGSIVSGEALIAVRRMRASLIVYLLAGLLALVGLGFILGALYQLAASRFGPVEASVGFGGGFLLLSLLLVLGFSLSARLRRRRTAERRKAEAATVAATAALALLPALASRRIGLPLLLAPAIAFLGYRIFQENSSSPEDPPADED